jgi:hypothetical protein
MGLILSPAGIAADSRKAPDASPAGSGRPFQPGNWAQRSFSGLSAIGKDQRNRWSPGVMPIVSDGRKSILANGRPENPDAIAAVS